MGTSLDPHPSLGLTYQSHSENETFDWDKEFWFSLVILPEILFLCVCMSCEPCWLGMSQSMAADALSSAPPWVVEENHDGTNAAVQPVSPMFLYLC